MEIHVLVLNIVRSYFCAFDVTKYKSPTRIYIAISSQKPTIKNLCSLGKIAGNNLNNAE